MCLPWRQGSIPARVREEGKGVRIREPQYTQGCKKIERAAVQVNYRRTNLLRRGLQIRQKVGFSDQNALCLHKSRSEAAYRDAAIYRKVYPAAVCC